MYARPTLVALALALLPASSAQAQQGSPEAYMRAIEASQSAAGEDGLGELTIEELMDELGVPGVSVAVIHDFAVHWEKGYGTADVETGAPVDTETLFQAASISKPVAAMAVLNAVEEGLFTLHTDVNDILESWQLDGGGFTNDRPVTPLTLTSHTSGLGDGFGFPGYDPEDELPTVVQILEGQEPSNVRRVFMEREPMSAEEYSGGGVTVMQLALSDAWGRPFEDILREHVLEPIGMTRSSFQQPISPENDANAARAHDGQGQSRGQKWHVYPEMAAAGLWTTAGDLARFAVEVQRSAVGRSNRVLSEPTVQYMLSPVGVGDFAVGFVIVKRGEGWYFQHGGGNWGFRCLLLAHKSRGYGLAIMTNSDRGSQLTAELSRRIQAAYGWDSLDEPVRRGYDPIVEREEVEVDGAILARYVGHYRIGDLILEITLDDGRLYGSPDGQGPFPLYAESESKFFLKVAPVQLTFTRDEAGEVAGVIVHEGGEEDRAGERYDPPGE